MAAPPGHIIALQAINALKETISELTSVGSISTSIIIQLISIEHFLHLIEVWYMSQKSIGFWDLDQTLNRCKNWKKSNQMKSTVKLSFAYWVFKTFGAKTRP